MKQTLRRKFIGAAGLAAGATWVAIRTGLTGTAFAADAPDEILNPVEVSGDEAVPVMGRLPGAKRMYVLPSGSGSANESLRNLSFVERQIIGNRNRHKALFLAVYNALCIGTRPREYYFTRPVLVV